VLRVGLTGGIACGKSEVARRFAVSGLETLDLDVLAHELTAPGRPAYGDVVAEFGRGVLAPDGSIDRRALGAIVFRSASARERLNALVHPRVREEEARRLGILGEQPAAVFVTDAALLVEAGMHLRFDRLVVVHCPPELQVARLQERDSLSEREARARVAAQMPIEAKRRFAHFTVDTSGTLSETKRAADALAVTLRDLGVNRPRPEPVPRARALGALLMGPTQGPCGLTTEMLATHLVSHGGLDLPALASAIDPPVRGPWYEGGLAPSRSKNPAGPEPASLVAPLVLFLLARHGHDPERLAAAAHSLAWLMDPRPERVASAVLMALLLGHIAVAERIPDDIESRLVSLRCLAARWGGAEEGGSVTTAARAAMHNPRDAAAARAACAKAGAEPGLAGAMVGLVVGSPGGAPVAWESFLRALQA
jgi:dephospho-CoA kinase